MIYDIGGGWGDAINVRNWKDGSEIQRVVGWKTRRPVQGDRLRIPMTSGKTALFEFVEVEYLSDPPDMFFADVKFVAYDGDEAVSV